MPSTTTQMLEDSAKLIGRLLLVAIFIQAGYGKIGGYQGTVAYMNSMGVPGLLLPGVIAVELVAGLMIALGFKTRLAAIALAGFTVVAAVLFHYQPADRNQMIHFMKNLAIAGGFLMVAAAGPGRYAIETLIGRRSQSAAA